MASRLSLAASCLRVFVSENMGAADSHAVAPELEHDPKCQQSVASAALEVDAGGFCEISNRNRDVSESEIKEDGLSKKLSVEDKVVGVLLPRKGFQNLAPIGSKATVEVTQVLSQHNVLKNCQATIRNILPCRHAALQSFPASANT